MAVQHYRAIYGDPAPMTWREISVAFAAVLAVAGPVAALVVRVLWMADGPGPSEDTIAMQPEVTR